MTATNESQYQVDCILDASWGCDQTNIDFYKIVKRSAACIWLVPLRSKTHEETGFLSRNVIPGDPKETGNFDSLADSSDMRWDGKPIRRKLYVRDGKITGCKFKDGYGWISAWNGKPVGETSYH